jgi:hypothetical protein
MGFPASWCTGKSTPRSHEPGHDHWRFQLRLDHDTAWRLETFMQTFHRSAAEIIRRLITHATAEDFPSTSQHAVEECRHGRRGEMHE